jgi:site-specific recombinase XerD
MHRNCAKLLTTALRSFLRYARYRGDITTDLAAAVPCVANWSMTSIPRGIPADAVRRLLASIDRRTPLGRRDYAILLLLARLGLRASEVALLELDDIDWEAGQLSVRGKGGRHTALPLSAELGEAIAAYLRQGRPRSTSRRVFLRIRAPIRGFLGPRAVGSLVRHALARAGVEAPSKGAHQFRHALAMQMLHHGASLTEIGEVLRHRSPQTTTIYAKVDLAALRPLALPWPGGVR